MKKIICVLLTVSVICALVACGSESKDTTATTATASDESVAVSEADTYDDETTVPVLETVAAEESQSASSSSASGIDVDLTTLSSTMVYSEVYNMLVNPEEYVGKMVKMNGQFALYQAVDSDGNPVSDQLYYACVIADATACCQQGMEFILGGGAEYPDDYPEVGDEITVSGEFQTYLEDDVQYCHLVDAVLE